MNISSSCAWYFWRIARGNFNWGQDCDIGAIAICIVYRRNSKIRNCSHTLTGRRLENITIISLQGWSIACWGVDGKFKILSKYLAFGKEEIPNKRHFQYKSRFSCNNSCAAISLWNWHNFIEGHALPQCKAINNQAAILSQNVPPINLKLKQNYKTCIGSEKGAPSFW